MGYNNRLATGGVFSEEQVHDMYLHWLFKKAGVNHGDPTYVLLATKLHNIPFIHYVPNDDNRAEDGIELRKDFIEDERLTDYELIMLYNHDRTEVYASVLEMLVALCERMVQIVDESSSVEDWFLELLNNLELLNFDDYNYDYNGGDRRVDLIMTKFLERKYKRNGRGGLFPLSRAIKDQRKVEIWYQMNAYLRERYYES